MSQSSMQRYDSIWQLSRTQARQTVKRTTTQVAVLGRTWHMFDMQVLVDTITAVNESHLPTQEEPQGLLAASIFTL